MGDLYNERRSELRSECPPERRPGERALLGSDGLSGVAPDDRIAAILGQTGVPLENTCRGLIDAANEAGGPDNITALVLAIDVP